MRLSELTRHLELLQLSARRLSGRVELGSFYQSCLAPLTATQFPLAVEQLEGVDTPPAVRRLPAPAAVLVCPDCGASLPGWAFFCSDCGASLQGVRGALTPLPDETAARSPAPLVEVPPDLPLAKRKAWHGWWHRAPDAAPARRTLFPQLADLLAPSAIEVTSEYLRVGDEWQQVLVVTGLPRTVEAGWLRPLLDLDEPCELSVHLCPQDARRMEDLLRRKRTWFQATTMLARHLRLSKLPLGLVGTGQAERGGGIGGITLHDLLVQFYRLLWLPFWRETFDGGDEFYNIPHVV